MNLKKLRRAFSISFRAFAGKKHPGLKIVADVRQYRNGKLIWEGLNQEVMLNGLMDEGEQNILDAYFRAENTPSSFYLGLGNNGGNPGVPADTATLATITEVSGTGYARQALARNTTDWPTLALDSGDYQVTSKELTFTAGGTWTAADYIFLADVLSGTSGKLIATVALSTSRVLQINDQIKITMKIKLQ